MISYATQALTICNISILTSKSLQDGMQKTYISGVRMNASLSHWLEQVKWLAPLNHGNIATDDRETSRL
jgi:hypothetical protein